MYQSAIHIGSRQFQQQERVRILCENQDDQQARLLELAQRADDVDARYGDAIDRTDKALSAVTAAPTKADYVALESTVRRQRHALVLLTLANLAVALLAVLR